MPGRVVLVQLALLCTLGMGGTCASRRATAADPAAEAARVRMVVDQFFSAAQKHDWDAAAELMSADFELYTDGAAAFNKQDYVKVLKEDDLQMASMELRDVEIRVASDGEMAWGKYRGLFKSSSRGQSGTMET